MPFPVPPHGPGLRVNTGPNISSHPITATCLSIARSVRESLLGLGFYLIG